VGKVRRRAHDRLRTGIEPRPFRLPGVGPGFVTDNFVRARDRLDEILTVEDETAHERTRRIARTEGRLVGVTSGAAAWVAGQLLRRPEFDGRTIVCFFNDSGERCLSVPGLFPAGGIETAS